MGRMYSGKKGKAGSKRPVKKRKLTWIRYSPKEIEQLIIKLAKQGKSQSEIGMILRDTYGVPGIRDLLKRTLNEILVENKLALAIPEDLSNLIKHEIRIKKHLEIHKHDMHARRGLLLTNSKINRVVKYCKRIGKLPQSWNYDTKTAEILIK
ncbi:MAG: 30S ribosomal protein S15 [Nanoarchaeota archaeon]